MHEGLVKATEFVFECVSLCFSLCDFFFIFASVFFFKSISVFVFVSVSVSNHVVTVVSLLVIFFS